MENLLRLLPGPQPILVRYGITVVLVLLTFALRLELQERTGQYGFILFVPAIVTASLMFDRGSGFLALGLSTALIANLLRWDGLVNFNLVGLTTFIIIGGGLVFVSEGLRRALERARKAEQEKDLLLQEMSHRVKNKFAMIASMIELQGRSTPAPEVRAALESIGARVRVITRVHDYLQLSQMDGSVNVRQYLEGLCRSLEETLQNLRPVSISVTCTDVVLPPEKALPLGLIVNELVTNAVKYAFPDGREGFVHVRLDRHGEGLKVSVSDNGIGCPQETATRGLGTKLVRLLAAQLGGSASWEAVESGCRASAEFSA
jgi:two-component sensor histidine kinase